jgi:branched-chain amino acid transport system ATP-binding protein
MTAATQSLDSGAPLLTLTGVVVSIGDNPVLHDVSLSVPKGALTVVFGRNGAGKTTTLRTIIGLLKHRSGQVVYAGEELGRYRPFERARMGIGFVPEQRAIFSDLTVEENLRIAERARGDLAAREDEIYTLFPDLYRLRSIGGTNLSGGQQQMLAIARALVPDNELLLVDEPFEGLAPVIVELLLEAFKRVAETRTVLMVEQNFRAASEIAQSAVVIAEGETVYEGAMADLFQRTDFVERYLGVSG